MTTGLEHIWYDVEKNELIVHGMSLAECVMFADRAPEGIKKIETTRDYKAGRLIHASGSILEYIDEL